MSMLRRLYLRALLSTMTLIGLLSIGLVAPAQAAPLHQAGPRTWHVSVGVETKGHAIQGMGFFTPEIWINKGDTVVWTSHAGEIHTVTFLATGQKRPPFNPGDPNQAGRVGGSSYDGHSYFNSGLLVEAGGPLPSSYSLTFNVTGNFNYLCLVHTMMAGKVHVRAAGTAYPFTQQQYNRKAHAAEHALLAHGRKLLEDARENSNNHNVTLGVGDGMVDIMRYVPGTIHIKVNDTVKFTNKDAEAPHTVTFGPEPQDGGFSPYGGTTFTGQPLNSGFLGAAFPFGKSITIKFAKAGTFQFRCVLHDDLGMIIKIVVK